MAYIRTKKISDKFYCYLVENKHTKKGPRQKVKKYLGKVISLEQVEELEFSGDLRKSNREILLELIKLELLKHGFKLKKELYVNKDLSFDLEKLVLKNKKKEVVLKINEGFLCNFTLKRILDFKKSNDINEDGLQLAKYFVEAGIVVPKEVFIIFYQKNK